MEALPEDYSRGKPYSAHVRAYFKFKNNTKRTVTGLLYHVTFKDSFNEILYQTDLKLTEKILPGKSNPMNLYWYWEDNPFIHGEIYDNLSGAASAQTIKVEVKLKKAAFSDGGFLTL